MSDDIVARLPQTGLIPSQESDLQVVHGLAAELRDIAHDHARHDGFVKFSGTRWMSYYHSLDRILMEHDRRQAEIYKSADEIERLQHELDSVRLAYRGASYDRDRMRSERDDARREVCEWVSLSLKRTPREVEIKRGWDCFGKYQDESGDECQREAL